MADDHQLPPGNIAFGRLSALNSLNLSRSSPPVYNLPSAYLAEQLSQAKNALCISSEDLSDISAAIFSALIPS